MTTSPAAPCEPARDEGCLRSTAGASATAWLFAIGAAAILVLVAVTGARLIHPPERGPA